MNEQLAVIDKELKNLESQQKEEKLNDRIKIEKQIDTTNESIVSLKTETDKTVKNLKSEISSKEQEIWMLKSGLSAQQDAEIQKLKLVYDNKKSEIKKTETVATADLESFKTTFYNKEKEYTNSNNTLTSVIRTEQSRIIIAVQNIDCPVRTEVEGKVVLNWKNNLSCVKSLLTSAKPYSTNIFNAYCKDQNLESYLSTYKSYLKNLSTEDIDVVKNNSNADWFEKMIN